MTRQGSIGKVVNMGSSSSLVVKGSEAPNIGTTVSDKRGRLFGKIIRITGPVKLPYIIVKVSREADLSRMLGQEMYLAGSGDRKEKRRRPQKKRQGGKRGTPAEGRKVHKVKRVRR